jgi:hypothetical protein
MQVKIHIGIMGRHIAFPVMQQIIRKDMPFTPKYSNIPIFQPVSLFPHPRRKLNSALGDTFGIYHHAFARLPLQDAAHGTFLGIG